MEEWTLAKRQRLLTIAESKPTILLPMQNDASVTERIQQLHAIAKKLVKNKVPDEVILDQLQKEGLDANYASTIIENVKSDVEDRKDFWKLLLMGIFFILAGLAINYYSFKIAEYRNSFVVYIFWGVVASGAVLIFRAFILFWK